MPVPVLNIGGVDYAEKCLELKPSVNGLNADGSGSDVQTGEMLRTKIVDKLKFEVSMDRLSDSEAAALSAVLKQTFYDATVLNPETGLPVTRSFYTDTIPFGVQRYDKFQRQTYYDGMTFSMTKK